MRLWDIILNACLLAHRAPGGDTTPGGSADALLLENGTDGILLEDGSGVLLME